MFFAEIPQEEKDKVVDQLDQMIEKTIERGRERFKKEMEDAVDGLMGSVTLWEDSVRENTGSWDFVRSAQESVWRQMLSSDPSRWSKYQIRDLFNAWRERHPEMLKQVVDLELMQQLEEANESLRYFREMANNRY